MTHFDAPADGAGQATAHGGAPETGELFWREHTRISLQPVAAPSVLGLFGLAVPTFMVSANLAGWYGDDSTHLVLFPFALAFGGVAQLLAAMWSYRARDALATAVHGAWGSFWIGYGLYFLLVSLAVLPGPTSSPVAETAFGYWFVGLAAVTWSAVAASLAENLALFSVLLTLATGSTLLAVGLVVPVSILVPIGAVVLVASAVLAWYAATAMMLRASYKRVVLPVGEARRPEGCESPVGGLLERVHAEPGIKAGQ